MLDNKTRTIWQSFLDTEATDFARFLGYGPTEIKRIGIRKFIKANDWLKPADVSKWRTDAWKVVICPACGKDFGILNDDMGLCDTCIPQFDLDRYFNDVHDIVGADNERLGEAVGKAVAAFMVSKPLREKYRKQTS